MTLDFLHLLSSGFFRKGLRAGFSVEFGDFSLWINFGRSIPFFGFRPLLRGRITSFSSSDNPTYNRDKSYALKSCFNDVMKKIQEMLIVWPPVLSGSWDLPNTQNHRHPGLRSQPRRQSLHRCKQETSPDFKVRR